LFFGGLLGKEFETQLVNVNKDEIISKLRSLGAKEEEEVLQKRWVYDIECKNGEDVGLGRWIRLREVNGEPSITYKNKKGRAINETEEIEIKVSDFEKAHEILSNAINSNGKYYQENKRHKFILNEIEFTLDTWPKIPTILEIEGNNEEKVKEGLKILNLEGKDLGHVGLPKIYELYGINMHSYKELKFDE
jgi:adenylate cyclase, class 2